VDAVSSSPTPSGPTTFDGTVAPDVAGSLTAWLAALAAGRASVDRVAEAIQAGTDGHVVDGLPGAASELTAVEAVTALQELRVVRLTMVLPVAGDPLGLNGASAFTTAAVAAATAAVAVEYDGGSLGWVPEPDLRGSSYRGVRWRVYPGSAASPPVTLDPERIIEQADRALRRALRAAAESLENVDLAHWRPEVAAGRAAADAAIESRVRALPPGWPPSARALAERALALWKVVQVANADPGAATASSSAVRTETLRGLSRAVREAATVAYNVPAAALLRSR
jgi:hypothetical protein